jgi:hypothetical protein
MWNCEGDFDMSKPNSWINRNDTVEQLTVSFLNAWMLRCHAGSIPRPTEAQYEAAEQALREVLSEEGRCS